MGDNGERPAGAEAVLDYSILPPRVARDQMIATVDAEPVPDPDGGRILDRNLAPVERLI